jgi:hypothetical protein
MLPAFSTRRANTGADAPCLLSIGLVAAATEIRGVGEDRIDHHGTGRVADAEPEAYASITIDGIAGTNRAS